MEITEQQKQIAKLLEIEIKSNDSFRTLKANIIDQIAEAIGEKEREDPTEGQLDYAESLGMLMDDESRRVISAKIADELERRNRKALKKLKIKPGSKIRVRNEFGPKDFVVSSIKENGKIYFKGIGCPQAWASNIEKVINS
jgi:hypothetical protein